MLDSISFRPAVLAMGMCMKLDALAFAAAMIAAVQPSQASTQDDAYQIWFTCLQTNASMFARSKETTETAADATMGACKTEEEAYSQTAYRTPTMERFITGPRRLDGAFVARHEAEWNRVVTDVRAMVLSKIAAFRVGQPQP